MALLAAVVRAPGLLIVRAPVLPVELRFVGPVAPLGAPALGLVLEAAAGPILGLVLLGGADIAPVAGPLAATLLFATSAGLALSVLVLLAALALALLVVLALTAIGLLPPSLLAALASLVLLLASIAALAAIPLVLLVLHLRLAAGHSFVDSAFAPALLVGATLQVTRLSRLLAAHLLGLLAALWL
ncbi:conserved hypothetical protein [Haloterrigena turkmenica DSM 5511]|uniref:Uncharacterized protein n=1 Tax=Haloterrigena turkmenica (strain ATCC 51198 / DSM 5511 / JCM 9101 / NCIMB 13204 / VKM B-1734 / 4k) TaxID=543526 RepID=D2RZM1_HALTV|nr:conserved hypothetical protein [Haloterrigena turkmenica DSM 5511]